MRKTFLAAVAMTGAGFLAFYASPTEAAVLSVGEAFGPPFGGSTCADVFTGSLNFSGNTGTKVQALECLAGPEQQYEFYGETIFTVGGQRCLDVFEAGTAPGTPVQSYPCNNTAAQKWWYSSGQIVYLNGGGDLCLDAGNMASNTQLVVNECDGSAGQFWQIK
jgi:Ricin-type beta-trefoil lectin domain